MRGTGLVLLLFLLTSLLHYSRWALPEKEDLPAFFCLQPQMSTVVVVDDTGKQGIYQFNDASSLFTVIKMTRGVAAGNLDNYNEQDQLIISGQILKVAKTEKDFITVERSWLSAQHRMLLHIPLHPDRMTLLDWESLPGIGPSLAQAIELDRQKNGDFKEFSSLQRVKGIGPKKLEAWLVFFVEKNKL